MVNFISNWAKKTWWLSGSIVLVVASVSFITSINWIIENFFPSKVIPKEEVYLISILLALGPTILNINKMRSPQVTIEEIMARLEANGFNENSSPPKLTPTLEKEINLVLEMAEKLVKHGIEIDPWTEITLGNAARLAGKTNTAQQNYLRALELFRGNGDRKGEANSLNYLGTIADTRGNLDEAERLHQESLAISRDFSYRGIEAE